MSGSGVQLPKWKSYTLPSWEQVHILREPPKSIHTRKKERVDMSNVNYMIRNDDTRINEGINYLQRGVNPMVDVMYNNVGGGGGNKTTSFANIQASNPYKVMKDGAFRPPIFTQKDLLPLSRMARPDTAVITNPGVRDGYNVPNLMDSVDKQQIHSSVDVMKSSYLSVRPTAVFKMQLPQEVFTANAINEDFIQTSASTAISAQNDEKSRMMYRNINDPTQASKDALLKSATSNIGMAGDVYRDDNIDINNYIKDNVILKNISPNFSVLIYNPNNKNYSEVFASTKEKVNIAVQSSMNKPIDLTREDGTSVKLKEYRWQIVQSAAGRDNLVLQILNSPELMLDRNVPLYAAGSNISGFSKNEYMHTSDPITDQKVKTSAFSSSSLGYGRRETIHDTEHNIKLRGMGSVGSMIDNVGAIPSVYNRGLPTLSSKAHDVRQEAFNYIQNRVF